MAFEKRKKIQAMKFQKKVIQAMAEGGVSDVELESLLTGIKVNDIDGLENSYKSYLSQVKAIYRKYNGKDSFGNAQTRALVDMRSSFIGGEGLSVSAKNPETAKFLETYITNNRLNGAKFLKFVKSGEMTGHVLLQNKAETKTVKEILSIKLTQHPYSTKYPNNFMPKFSLDNPESMELVAKDSTTNEKQISLKDKEYVLLGGDDIVSEGPTTKIGIILPDIENYDRAQKDMRLNNHILARITPNIECKSEGEVKKTMGYMKQLQWKIGKMLIGTGKFKYETPGTGCHDNLKTEMSTNLKTISAVSGMPVHWLGWVDMMSNRSTAESLFEAINNATISERAIWQDSMYNIMLKAQELYIDSGGADLTFDPDFEVKIPLIDYSNLKERMAAWSMAFHDGAISMGDYRNQIPSIDPLKTKKAIEDEVKEELKALKSTFPNPGIDEDKKSDKGEDNV